MGCFPTNWKCISALCLATVLVAQTKRELVNGFSLEAPAGNLVSISSAAGRPTVVIFVSARCPISNAFNARINTLYEQFGKQVNFIVLDSNVNESAAEIQAHAKAMEYDFPVYRDRENRVADLLGAVATPDSFVIDKHGMISYHGYIEDAPNPARSKDPALRLAIEAALHERPAPVPETHARGCAIRRTVDLRP